MHVDVCVGACTCMCVPLHAICDKRDREKVRKTNAKDKVKRYQLCICGSVRISRSLPGTLPYKLVVSKLGARLFVFYPPVFAWHKTTSPGAFQVALVGKTLLANAGDLRDEVLTLGREDPLKEGITTHSSLLAWRISWTEKPGGLQSMGSHRVGDDWSGSRHRVVPTLFALASLLNYIGLFLSSTQIAE